MSTEYKASIQQIAESICARGLASPAIFALELHKPLIGILREIALVSAPLFSAIFGYQYKKAMDEVLESRDRVEELIVCIEKTSGKAGQRDAGR